MTLQFASAKDCADYLRRDPNVTQDDLHSVLINAMERIDFLEKHAKAMQEELRKHGILPNLQFAARTALAAATQP